MTGRRILVTGLGGFAGRHLAAAVSALLPDAVLLPLGCDVTDGPAVAEAVRGARPELCLHLAAIAAVPVANAEPDRTWSVNLHGTLNLARAVRTHAPGAPFLPLAPMNTYGASKAAADLALGAMAADGLHAIRLRPFNHAGPGQAPDFAIPAFARQIALIRAGRQEPVLRTGNLQPHRDFLDVRDVCRAYALCLARADRLPPGTILNIASGTARRIGDLLDGLLAAAGLSVAIESDPGRARPTDIARAVGDASRLRDTLGWAPEVPWERTLRDVIDDWTMRIAHG